MRFVRSPEDDLAFERIVNTPKRGIGESSVQKIAVAARDLGVPMGDAARALVSTDEIRGKARTGLQALLRDVDRWREQARSMRHDELAEIILDESGYTAMWREDKSPSAAGRLDNLKELVQSMGEYDSLEGYLEHVALLTDVDRAEQTDQTAIMTLHAAKGLEFPLVFLPGWEETVFPSQRALDEGGAASLEEERRLAYVGVTRARERCVISFTANRQIFGRWQSVIPSRFIDELPPAHVEAKSETGYYDAGPGFEGVSEPADPFRSSYDSPGWKRFKAAQAAGSRRDPGVIEGRAELISTLEDAAAGWKPGDRCFHQKFGYGTVKTADGAKLTVDFDKAGPKKVVASFIQAAP